MKLGVSFFVSILCTKTDKFIHFYLTHIVLRFNVACSVARPADGQSRFRDRRVVAPERQSGRAARGMNETAEEEQQKQTERSTNEHALLFYSHLVRVRFLVSADVSLWKLSSRLCPIGGRSRTHRRSLAVLSSSGAFRNEIRARKFHSARSFRSQPMSLPLIWFERNYSPLIFRSFSLCIAFKGIEEQQIIDEKK